MKTDREKNFKIRQGCQSDKQALAELLEAAQMETDVDPAEFLVAEENGKLAGGVRLVWRDGEAYLRPVVVTSKARGNGIGRALLEKLFLDCHKISVIARGEAILFYRRLGFVEIDWAMVPSLYRNECGLCPEIAQCRPLPLKWINKTR